MIHSRRGNCRMARTKPGSTDRLGLAGVGGEMWADAVAGRVVCRTLLSGMSTLVFPGRAGAGWVVRWWRLVVVGRGG